LLTLPFIPIAIGIALFLLNVIVNFLSTGIATGAIMAFRHAQTETKLMEIRSEDY
jgi:hypothetical protein